MAWLDALRNWRSPNTAGVVHARYLYWRDGKMWVYALVSGNNEPLSASTQGYESKSAVLRAIAQHRSNAATGKEVEAEGFPEE